MSIKGMNMMAMVSDHNPPLKNKHHGSPDFEDDLAEDGDEEADEADNFEDEGGWEPCARPGLDEDAMDQAYDDDPGDTAEHREAQKRTQQHLRSKTFIVPFPGVHAGASINQDNQPSAYENYKASIDASSTNPYAPFVSAVDWKVARWAKMRGPGSTAVTELLEIEEVCLRSLVQYVVHSVLCNLIACLASWSFLQELA